MISRVLHLTHSDIRSDSRILKELRAIEDSGRYDCIGVGIRAEIGASSDSRKLRSPVAAVRLVSGLFWWLPRPLRYSLNMLEITLRFTFRGIFARPQLVHCHDTMVLPAGWLIKLATGCKLVYDAHELESDKRGQSGSLAKATLLMERWCWRRIDLLVSVSDSILSWYEEQLGAKRTVLVMNSPEMPAAGEVGTGRYPGSGAYFHETFGIPENHLIFVYLGILSDGRGIQQIVEAFSESALEASVVLVGYGPMSEWVEEQAGKQSNIYLHEAVPHNEVVRVVRSADVGFCLIEDVSLSDHYSLPNKLFEYLFAGLHVRASDLPEIRKLVEEYSAGVCCALDSTEIRKKVEYLVANPVGRVTSDLSALSWSAQAERLVREYDLMFETGELGSTN